MEPRNTFRGGTVALAIAALLTAAQAQAETLPDSAIACRAAIAKNYPKLLKTASKVIAGCHKARDKGGDDINCNDISIADAAKGKYEKARAKAVGAMGEACTGQEASLISSVPGTAMTQASTAVQHYVSCPVTCAGVPTNPMTTMTQVVTCLGCLAGSIVGDVSSATLGLPTVASYTGDDAKCHGAIAKNYAKYLDTYVKSSNSCQKNGDAAGTYATGACDGDDPKDKVSGALTKAGGGIDKSCAGATASHMDGCSATDFASLKACSAPLWTDAASEGFSTIYDLESTLCPTTIRTVVHGNCSVGADTPAGICISGHQTGTQLSVGWKGLAHGVDITDNYTLAADVTCPGTEKGTCGTCTIDNTSYDNPQYASFLRCAADPSTPCTHPFANDAVCPGGLATGACRYFLGPPLAVSRGGTFTCTLNKIESEVTGTVDPDSGESLLNVDLRAIVHNGLGQNRPCPICLSDTTPLDGVPNGTCFGGSRDGLACDVQGYDLSFARSGVCTGGTNPGSVCNDNNDCCKLIPDGMGGETLDCSSGNTCSATPAQPHNGPSLDCPLVQMANISGSGLVVQLALSTGTSVKDAEDPCESPNQAMNCFCGVCTGDNAIPCNNDTECANLALGNCGIPGGGVPRKPNNCTNGVCTAVTSDRGECSSGMGDTENFCSGMLFANGQGVLSCSSDGDCDSYVTGSPNVSQWVCPGDGCGTCSISKFRSCFNDPISISGTPDPVNPVLAGTFCLPPSSNGAVNSATGTPGPGTVKTAATVELRYY